jgi:hypothetical protein
MPTTDITNAQVLTVLKHLANGRQPDFVAQVTHLPQSLVERIAEDHDWPDMDRIRKGIFNLTQAELATPQAAAASPAAARPAAATPPAAPQQRPDLSIAHKPPTPQPAPAPEEPRTASSSAAELLHMATESTHARTRNLGTKISSLLADLSQRLNDEEAEHVARLAAKAEQDKKAKRIAELEAELAHLKGKKPAPTAKATGGRTYTLVKGDFPCAHCDRVLDTAQGRAAHQRRAHEGFDPNAAAKTA